MRALLTLCAALAATPAAAAPFAILHVDERMIDLVDLGTLTRTGDRAGYDRITMMSAAFQPIPVPLDRAVNRTEVDCAGRQMRSLATAVAERGGELKPQSWASEPSDWMGIEDDELALACTGQTGRLQVIPSLDVARAILNSGAGRETD